MNISTLIFEYLLSKGKVSVEGLGTFLMENAPAEIVGERIIPPSKKISFRSDDNEKGQDFTGFYAKKSNQSFENAEQKIFSQVNLWKKGTQNGEAFEIEELGKLVLDQGQLTLVGRRIEADNPDSYGLENVSIAEITAPKQAATVAYEYRFSRHVLWFFLLIIPVAGLIYLGIMNSEMLFGKKSVLENSYEKATHRIEDKPIKKEVLPIKNDSLKVDTTTVSH